jgi:hypothetical protein
MQAFDKNVSVRTLGFTAFSLLEGIRWLALAALIGFLPACHLMQSKPVHLDIESRAYPQDVSAPLKRVLVLPFYNETEYTEQGPMVEQAFSQALSERGCFEVVALQPEDTDLIDPLKPYSSGTFSLTVLMELGEWYRADAVLLGCLKLYDPYHRPKIGMKADLISVYDGSVLRTVNGVLDSGEDDVARDLVNYFDENHNRSHEESLYEWRCILNSPHMYARYACNRFVNAMYPETLQRNDA